MTWDDVDLLNSPSLPIRKYVRRVAQAEPWRVQPTGVHLPTGGKRVALAPMLRNWSKCQNVW